MALHLRPSVGSATGSEYKVFISARLKLTAVYVLILGLILVVFSVVLYKSFEGNLSDASEDTFSGIESHHQFVEDTLSTVRNEILFTDIIILLIAAGVSYVLADYTLKPIQRSMENQRKFSENASHELRTPLAVMKNDIEVLLRNPSPSKELTQETLRSNIEEINRMSKMTKDLLVIARAENNADVAEEKLDIGTVVQVTADRLRPFAESKSIRLSVSADSPLYVLGTTSALERVITNLLQNAIEYTPPNGSIMLSAKKSTDKVLVSVADTGVGIDAKDVSHIFERFYKGEGATGSGLGLSIVKELIKLHGGEVSIESEKGNGTKISFSLPVIS